MNKERVLATGLALSLLGGVTIMGFEDFRLNAYDDGAGTPTIGIGSVAVEGKPVKMGDTITPRRAVETFVHDIRGIGEAAVKECVTVPLTQGEFDALVSLAYNIGRKRFCGSTLVKTLNKGDYERAGKLFTDPLFAFVKSKGVAMQGLILRRQKERAMFEGR